jgi:hypothetical protein
MLRELFFTLLVAPDGPNPAVNAAKSWLTDATQL